MDESSDDEGQDSKRLSRTKIKLNEKKKGPRLGDNCRISRKLKGDLLKSFIKGMEGD